MNEELEYSIHLRSDKNKTTKAKKVAKTICLEKYHLQTMEYKMQHSYQKRINTI